MKTRSEFVAILNKFEENYPVNTWKFGGVDVWPIVKFELFTSWRNKIYRESTTHLKATTTRQKQRIIQKILSFISSCLSVLSLRFSRKRRVDLIFAGAYSHRVDFGGSFINRYYFPIKKTIENKGVSSLSVEYNSRLLNKTYPDNTLFIEELMPFYNFQKKFSLRSYEKSLSQFSNLLSEFDNEFPGIINPTQFENAIYKKIETIISQSKLFKLVLKNYQPKIVFTLCYYSSVMYALIHQCKKMNILTCDIQHGGIGNSHPAYSWFHEVPTKGYSILPDVFWVWDAASENSLNKWINNQRHHKVFKGGNPWLSFILKETKQAFVSPQKKIILYTLQLDLPDDYIIQAIKETPSDFQWWLRMHPRTLHLRKELITHLSQHQVLNRVNVEEATSYPLPELLKKATVHISKSSGSVIEAAQLNVITIVLDRLGVENYADYIDAGKIIPLLTRNSDELVRVIKNIQVNHSVDMDTEHEAEIYLQWISSHLTRGECQKEKDY